MSHLERQLIRNKKGENGTVTGVNGGGTNVEYLRNVFVKYLEYLALNNTKEIRTIEHVLFTELSITNEQSKRIDHLRR